MTDAILSAVTAQNKTMADGTLRVCIDFEPKDAVLAYGLFGQMGVTIAVAKFTNEVAQEVMRPTTKGPYGEYYTQFYRNGFWFNPKLQEALGIHGEIEHMIGHGADKASITDTVKGAIYEKFNVDSLSNLDPHVFSDFLVSHNINHPLPE